MTQSTVSPRATFGYVLDSNGARKRDATPSEVMAHVNMCGDAGEFSWVDDDGQRVTIDATFTEREAAKQTLTEGDALELP